MNNSTEIWRAVKGYEGHYEVSNLGRVKSLARKWRINTIILKPAKDIQGYLFVSLHKNNILNGFKIHRLVAQAFIPNPENKPQTNHKDGVKANNRVENLEWNTSAENMNHAWKTGLHNNDHLKRKVVQFKNGKIVKEWESQRKAERELKINNSYISMCCNGKRETAGGFKWAFV